MTSGRSLDELIREEEELQFDSFTHDTALQIGLTIIELAKAQGKAVTIEIRKGAQQLFHYAFEGTSADNDDWAARKARVVERFGRSSFYLETELRGSGKTIAERYFLDPSQYAPYNGAFPIRVRGAGVIGAVAVSGLPGDQDHTLVTSALKRYFASLL
ncbi:heme-degrading domain-containing protein [Paenibacillus humicola]|uniref:heme-degrading domain-containing protein n=1 Tax=Paenibacillus humicola TaxID=3110540 RepID=UPI00237B47AA|nr:heme-degrading domain-containing protein [Paenibacillus humicola]